MSAEKDKQKAEVKHILQQKQRALSDLFKMLSDIGEFRYATLVLRLINVFNLRCFSATCVSLGLSYRKGLTWNRTADPVKTLCMDPLEMSTALSGVSSREQNETT